MHHSALPFKYLWVNLFDAMKKVIYYHHLLEKLVGVGYVIHWASWRRICYPRDKGDLCLCSLEVVQRTFTFMLWFAFQ